MLLPFCPRSARSALFLAFLILTTLAFVLADPVVQADSAPALLATRGSAQAGDKCTTNTDCYSKNCVNKVCQLQPAGGPCFKDGNCVSKSCSIPKGKTAGTCASTGSLPPRAACTANAQCLSGSCSSRVDRHDQYGDNTGFYLSDDIGHQGKNCQYLSLGQSGCRSNDDCGSGVCSSNGKCTALADGSRCLFNSQCGSSSVCSIKGKCYTPRPGSLTTGKVCTKDSQCYAGNCFKFNTTLVRPALQGNGTVTLADETCDQAYLRQLCHTDSDCHVGACLPTVPSSSEYSCSLSLVGESCPRDLACGSGVCSSKTHKCELPPTGHLCTSDSQCYSNSCTTNTCYASGDEYDNCPHSSCNPVPYGGKCRFDKDCDAVAGAFCNKGQCAH